MVVYLAALRSTAGVVVVVATAELRNSSSSRSVAVVLVFRSAYLGGGICGVVETMALLCGNSRVVLEVVLMVFCNRSGTTVVRNSALSEALAVPAVVSTVVRSSSSSSYRRRRSSRNSR